MCLDRKSLPIGKVLTDLGVKHTIRQAPHPDWRNVDVEVETL